MPATKRSTGSSKKTTTRSAGKKAAAKAAKKTATQGTGKAATKKAARKKAAATAARKPAKKAAKPTARKPAKKVRKTSVRKPSGGNAKTAAQGGGNRVKSFAKVDPSPAERHAMIEKAAYYRAEARGFDGRDPVADWLASEKEVDANLSRHG